MIKIIYLIIKGIELFFLLPLCMCSKSIFDKIWYKYYTRPLPKNIFNLCVQWLLYRSNKLNISYEEINVLIFCIIWPLITIFSIILNIILLIIWQSFIIRTFCNIKNSSTYRCWIHGMLVSVFRDVIGNIISTDQRKKKAVLSSLKKKEKWMRGKNEEMSH